MTLLGDFVMIQGTRQGVVIGDDGEHPTWETTFNTGGRRESGHAFLTFMIQGLTVATAPVPVKVNNKLVGHIFPYTGADGRHWFTQTINLAGIGIKNGDNELEIDAAINPTNEGGTYDDFVLRNVMCFFQQDS